MCIARGIFANERDELFAKLKQYHEARVLMNASVTSWNTTRKEISESGAGKLVFKRNPVVKSYGDRMDAAKNPPALHSPFHSPVIDR